MNRLIEQLISCPYCGEQIELLVDGSLSEQSYIEDCFVCCRPIHLEARIGDDEEVRLIASHENE
jgi:hypothetical protein